MGGRSGCPDLAGRSTPAETGIWPARTGEWTEKLNNPTRFPPMPRPGILSLLLLGGSSCGAWALPPAPPYTVTGIVRDAYGWPLGNDANARILVRSGGKTVGVGLVRTSADPGRNFTVAVPVDGGDDPVPYRPDVGTEDMPISLLVEIGGTLFPVAQVAVVAEARIEAGARIDVDLTIGEDTDGDLIPDEWERWQLELAGIAADDPRFGLGYFGGGDADGDGSSDYFEFVAGTFAFLKGDRVQLTVASVGDDGWVRLELSQVGERAYRIESSTNLTEWKRRQVFFAGDRSEGFDTWVAEEDGLEQLEIPAEPGGTATYRVVVK